MKNETNTTTFDVDTPIEGIIPMIKRSRSPGEKSFLSSHTLSGKIDPQV